MFVLLISVFILGYIGILFEHQIKLDKAATALMSGVLCWTIYGLSSPNTSTILHQLNEHIGEIAGILFFLIGAMTIVELIDLYDGFQIIISRIKTKSKRQLLLLITLFTFVLSAILDNLTTAIVMSSLVVKIVSSRNDRLLLIGMIVIAANAGGAWSPIGDVTTTMLWIGGQITAIGIIKSILLPSIVAALIPMLIFMRSLHGEFIMKEQIQQESIHRTDQQIIFFSGIGLLLFVPIFKSITHLPPFMGMLLAVGIVWAISETLHKKRHKQSNSPSSIFNALERIDMPSILFFLGILLSVSSLQASGILQQGANWLQSAIPNNTAMLSGIGVLSAIFDNVPLVAAIQGMFPLEQYPSNHFFWNYLAFCSGTGGSILIIGSAAGVAAMGIEKINFFWYLRTISLPALLGFIAGALVCIYLNG
mgnify:CR=1 FL=1